MKRKRLTNREFDKLNDMIVELDKLWFRFRTKVPKSEIEQNLLIDAIVKIDSFIRINVEDNEIL